MRANPKALLALLPFAVGCGAIGAGDYVIYRIAAAEETLGTECFPNGIDPNDSQDTSSFRTGETFAIFIASDGGLFLDTTDFVLAGTKSEGNYVFSADDVDVEFFGANDASFTTNTQSIDVTMDPAGARVTGTLVSGVDQTCNGSDCQTFDTFSCAGTTTFEGIRVNGVDLEHNL